jgi:hypothetical protein
MRLLNEWHEGTQGIRERFPEVEVVEVPLEGEVAPSLVGDALLAVPGHPRITAQLAGRVQRLRHRPDGAPDEAFGARVHLFAWRGAVPISEFISRGQAARRAAERWFAGLGGPGEPSG